MPPHPVDARQPGGEAQGETYIPIVTYHQVADVGAQPPGDNPARDYTRRPDFVAQMQYLAAEGFTAVTHEAVYGWLAGRLSLPDRPVMITFDDGRLSVLEDAFPVLQALGWPATVYVITGLAGGQRTRGRLGNVPSMTWDRLKELRDAGWTIGSHTRSHLSLTGIPAGPRGEEQLREELEGSRHDIETQLGVTPICFAYPGGRWNRNVERLVAEVYRSARLWAWRGRAAYCTLRTSPLRLPSMNVSFHLAFADFQRLVQRAQPAYFYQQELDWSGQPRGDFVHRARLFLERAARRATAPTSQIDEDSHV